MIMQMCLLLILFSNWGSLAMHPAGVGSVDSVADNFVSSKSVVAGGLHSRSEIVKLPSTADRVMIGGIGIVLVSGLGLLLNEKRRRADKDFSL